MNSVQGSIQAGLEQLLTDFNQARLSRISSMGERALAWLVVFTPGWTEELALAAEFPFSSGHGLSAFEEEGLVAWDTEAFITSDESSLESPVRRRAVVLDRGVADIETILATRKQLVFQTELQVVRERVRAATSAAPQLSTQAIERWLDVAPTNPRAVLHSIRQRLDAGEAGEALALLEAARAACRVIETPALSRVLSGATRLMEKSYRRSIDERALTRFLERSEQALAVNELLTEKDGAWGLHLLGVGGAGKTMLLRWVVASLAPKRGFTVARVDFDYLNPDYPIRRPAQFLVALVDDLALQLRTARQESYEDSFRGYVEELDEVLSAAPTPGDPLANLHRPQFDKVVDIFCDLVTPLPGPLVLLLDTCEELAKLDPSFASVPALDATFLVLERLKAKLPQLRVLFAGRRLLCRAGHGWAADAKKIPAASRRLRDHVPWLGLLPLRGFTRNETVAYLERLGVSAPEAFFALTGDTGILPLARDGDEEPRQNPFDVGLFGDWLKSDPKLDLEAARKSGADPYVESRILGRLESDALRSALPRLLLLRRVDRAGASLVFGEAAAETAYRQLAEQEWIDVAGDDLEINRSLLPRLLRYYQQPAHAVEVLAEQTALGPVIRKAIESAPAIAKVPSNWLDAALRCLPPHDGARLLELVDGRIARERAFAWAVRVFESILGEDGALPSGDPLRRSRALSTYAASLAHQQPGADCNALWAEVGNLTAALPQNAALRTLMRRALLNVATSEARNLHAADAAVAERARDRFQRNISILEQNDAVSDRLLAMAGASTDTASLLATGTLFAHLEARLDFAESRRTRAGLLELGSPLSDGTLGAGAAWALTLWARIQLDEKAWSAARAAFDAALAALPPRGQVVQGFIDWVPPASLRCRVRLEALRSGLYDSLSDDAEWITDAQAEIETIDGERLASLLLARRAELRVVPLDEVQAWQERAPYLASRRPTCLAHRRVEPLFVTLAAAYATLLRTESAKALVEQHVQGATASGLDPETAEFGRIASYRRARRARDSVVTLDYASASVLSEAWPALALTRGIAPARVEGVLTADIGAPLQEAHWMSQIALFRDDARALADAANAQRAKLAEHAPHVSDLRRAGLELAFRSLLDEPGDVVEEVKWTIENLADRYALRVVLRGSFLLLEDELESWPAAEVLRMPDAFKKRGVGVLALEELELALLRHPVEIGFGARLAVQALREVGDAPKELQAATLLLIGSIRSHALTADLREIVDSFVAPAYRRARTNVPGSDLPWAELPSFAAFQESLGAEGEALFATLTENPLGEWLARLACALVYLDEPTGKGKKTSHLEAVLARLYGEMRPPETRLVPPKDDKDKKDRWRGLGTNVVVVLVLAAIAGVALVTFPHLQRISVGALGWVLSQSWGWIVPWIGGVIILIMSARFMIEMSSSLRIPFALGRGSLELTSEGSERLNFAWRRIAFTHADFWNPRRRPKAAATEIGLLSPRPVTLPYDEGAAALPKRLRDALSSGEDGVWLRPVRIATARSAAPLPWEAWMRFATVKSGAVGGSLRPYRAIPGPALREPPKRSGAATFEGVAIQRSRGYLVGDVPVGEMLQEARVLVLQLPVVESLERTASAREQMAELRGAARQLAAEGADFVLALPGLLSDLSLAARVPLGTQLRLPAGRASALRELLSLVHRLRVMIQGYRDSPADSHDLSELAHDITLFVREDEPMRENEHEPLGQNR